MPRGIKADIKVARIHLNSAESLRRLISSTINRFCRGEITESEARTIGVLAETTLKILDARRQERILDEQ